MKLPVVYNDIPKNERWKVRLEYRRLQDDKCLHCGNDLEGKPTQDILDYKINMRLFPDGFLDHPVHLHHSHKTHLTLGAVHAKCNGVLWQKYGE